MQIDNVLNLEFAMIGTILNHGEVQQMLIHKKYELWSTWQLSVFKLTDIFWVHSKWDISPFEGHFGVKTIMAAILKAFQTEVLKTSPLKGPFRMKDFEGYNWWTLRAPMILCAESLHDDGASMSVRDDDAEGHFRKQLFGPLHLSNLRSSHYGGQPL